MLAQEFIDAPAQPFDLEGLSNTKGIRNFLCDWLYADSFVVSYAPNNEFPSSSHWKSFLGGWVVEFDSELKSYIQKIPKHKVHFRLIRELYDKGYLVARPDLKAPHKRFTLFTWSKEALKARRDILKLHILGEKHLVMNKALIALSGVYGVDVKFHPASRTFEIVKLDGSNIPRGTSSRTYALASKAGEPVSKLNGMPIHEWEELLYLTAKRAGTLNKPAPLEEGQASHLSLLKRNSG